MQIRINYFAQLKQAAGRADETLALLSPLTLRQLAELLSARDGRLRTFFPSAGEPAALAFVNGVLRAWTDPAPLAAGDEVTFLTPMAGG